LELPLHGAIPERQWLRWIGPVLAIAQENARQAGVLDRYRLLPGDALELDLGTGFDAVLIPNLLHMWDRPANERLLKKVYNSLAPKGRVVVVELAPDDGRTSPPVPAFEHAGKYQCRRRIHSLRSP
jgi:SAM-dependent methyltransferase